MNTDEELNTDKVLNTDLLIYYINEILKILNKQFRNRMIGLCQIAYYLEAREETKANPKPGRRCSTAPNIIRTERATCPVSGLDPDSGGRRICGFDPDNPYKDE
jgi:hypothetical protein